MDRLSFNRPAKHTTATATNATCTATATGIARKNGSALHLVGFIITGSAAPAAAVAATITGLKSGTITLRLPAAAFAPIVVMFPRPLEATDATDIVLAVPALGAGVVCDVTLLTQAA